MMLIIQLVLNNQIENQKTVKTVYQSFKLPRNGQVINNSKKEETRHIIGIPIFIQNHIAGSIRLSERD